MSGPPPSESQTDGPRTDQPHVYNGWDQSHAYDPYVHQPSMVAPGDANTHHGPIPHYNFQGFTTPQQLAQADQQATQNASNTSNSAYRTSFGPQHQAQFQDSGQMHHFQPTPPFYHHNLALQQPQFFSTDHGQPFRGDFQQAQYPGFNSYPPAYPQPNFSSRSVDSPIANEQDPILIKLNELEKANRELKTSMAEMQASSRSIKISPSHAAEEKNSASGVHAGLPAGEHRACV